MNSITEEVAKNHGVLHINLCSDLSFNIKTDFYDTMHVTPTGSKKIGDFIYSRIKEFIRAGKIAWPLANIWNISISLSKTFLNSINITIFDC